MLPKFVKITYFQNGDAFETLININDIAHLEYGFNRIYIKTPYANGNNSLQLDTQGFDKLVHILLNL